MNQNMLKQAQEMKTKLDKIQKELADTIIEVNYKNNVKVIIDGQQKIQSITISPKVVNPNKIEDLEGMILKAVNEAMEKSQKNASKQLNKVTGGLKIPGLF